MTVPFDTLALAKALEETSLGKNGAEAVARAIADVAMADLVTKRDLQQAVVDLKAEADAGRLRQTIALSAIVTAAVAIIAGLSHLFH